MNTQTRTKTGILRFLTCEQMADEIVRLDAALAATAGEATAAQQDEEKPDKTAACQSTTCVNCENCKSIAQEVAEYQVRYRVDWVKNWSGWERCSAEQAADYEHVPLLNDLHHQVRRLYLACSEPVDMILHCPACGAQHIDKPEGQFYPGHTAEESIAANKAYGLWGNPPHRSHLCHGCGHIWRPADVPTNGVAVIKTKGKNDSIPAAPANGEGAG